MWIIYALIHALLGFGVLQRLKNALTFWEQLALAYPLGLGTATLLTFLLDVFGIPLSFAFGGTVLATVLLFLPMFWARSGEKKTLFNYNEPDLKLSEIVVLLAITGMWLITFWRAYYLPVTPYDALVGIDLVAKFALLDGRIDSQMFTDLAGQLTTQPYYAPFTMLCQLIYRSAGHVFGQVWLGFFTLGFIATLYLNFRREVHPLLAGILTIVLLSIPEIYGYTFQVQTDFPNAVFVSLSIIYLYRYTKEADNGLFWLSAILMGFGCWSRSETIAFAALTAALFFLFAYKKDMRDAIQKSILFMGVSLIFFAIWNLYYLPVVLDYSPESYFKFFFWDGERLSKLFNGMVKIAFKINFWGYVPYMFIGVAVVNLAVYRDRKNLFLLLWVFGMFLGFLILLYHLQLNLFANINYTFRRGSFKMWPVAIFYLSTTVLFHKLSEKLKNWENS